LALLKPNKKSLTHKTQAFLLMPVLQAVLANSNFAQLFGLTYLGSDKVKRKTQKGEI